MKGRVLLVAGSDSGGGAGIQADIKTVTALNGYAATAITALTAQNTEGVEAIYEVPAEFVVQQMKAVLDDIGADIIKTGMLHREELIERVVETLGSYTLDNGLLVDPKKGALLGDYLQNADVFKCPSDKSTVKIGNEIIPRIRSISMSQSFGRNPSEGGGAGQWLPYSSFRTYMKEGDMGVPGPSNLFVFLDEHPNSINDAAFAVKCDARDGGARMIDWPASFHNGACGFAFGDGHAEIKKWLDKRTIVPHKNSNGMPSPPGGLNQAAPNSPDVAWMQDRASARKR